MRTDRFARQSKPKLPNLKQQLQSAMPSGPKNSEENGGLSIYSVPYSS